MSAHNHSHHHDHHHHEVSDLNNITTVFYIGIGLNLLFTLFEFIIGYAKNSMALVADASHNLSDVASLFISLIGMKLATKSATKLYTYGYKKSSILASLINSVLLVFIVINIFKESIEHLYTTPEVAGKWIIITASIGIVINSLSAFLFFKGQKQDINIKGAFLHLLVDALVSVGVVISGIVIYYTDWYIIDSIIGFVIAIVILISTWGLLKESVKLILDGVPQNVNYDKIIAILREQKNIKDVHHTHIWALSTTENALTTHIVLNETISSEELISLKKEIKHLLIHENIQHITLEFENILEDCQECC